MLVSPILFFLYFLFVNKLISKTFISPTLRLEQHLMWDDIAILTRYLLMLSFNDCLDGKISLTALVEHKNKYDEPPISRRNLVEMDKLCMHVFDEPRHNTQSLFDQPIGHIRVNLASV